jgi:glutathione-regulated potassium-efflux system ancillary protein KefC
MGLFFIAVGMSVDFGLLLTQPLTVIGLVLGLIAVKVALLWGLASFFDITPNQRPLFAWVLSQGGEFAFVLFSVAVAAGAIPAGSAGVLILVVALSMVTTPFLLIFNERYLEPRLLQPAQRAFDAIEEPDNPVIIAGYGRVGQMIGRLLQANGFPTTIIDHDPDQIDMLRRFGWKVYYGDAARLDLLQAAGAQQAKLLVIAVDDEKAALDIVDLAQRHFPTLPLIARARNRTHAYELLDRGVQLFERETFSSALRLGEEALKLLGWGAYEAHKAVLKFREHDVATMYKLHPLRQDREQFISLSKQSRADLERLFREERRLPGPGEQQHFDWS